MTTIPERHVAACHWRIYRKAIVLCCAWKQRVVPVQCKAWKCYESSCWWQKMIAKTFFPPFEQKNQLLGYGSDYVINFAMNINWIHGRTDRRKLHVAMTMFLWKLSQANWVSLGDETSCVDVQNQWFKWIFNTWKYIINLYYDRTYHMMITS